MNAPNIVKVKAAIIAIATYCTIFCCLFFFLTTTRITPISVEFKNFVILCFDLYYQVKY
jgi:hypothetical protein